MTDSTPVHDVVEKNLTDRVEKEFLLVMMKLLQSQEYDVVKAKSAATEYLTLLPFQNRQDFDSKIKSFTDIHPELKQMYFVLLSYDEEKRTDDLLSKMRLLMKDNKIEEAIQIAQK